MAATADTGPAPPQAAPQKAGGLRNDPRVQMGGQLLGLAVVFAWCIFPFLWMVLVSFQGTVALRDANIFGGPFTTGNYTRVFEEGFMWNLGNSIFVALSTTVISILVASLAAYAIARLPIAYKFTILAGTLVATVFPPVSLVPPLFVAFNALGQLNTYQAMIIPYVALTLPLSIFILTTFFATIPKEMEEAAKVDGATPFQTFVRVVVPLAAPGVFAAAILVFVYAVNEYLIAFSLASGDPNVMTVTVAIATLDRVGFEEPIGTITAASTIVSIPLIIFALAAQRWIVSGLTAGGVKG